MYEQIYSMKFLPPGRGLWAMGSELTGLAGTYVNCPFLIFTHTLSLSLSLFLSLSRVSFFFFFFPSFFSFFSAARKSGAPRVRSAEQLRVCQHRSDARPRSAEIQAVLLSCDKFVKEGKTTTSCFIYLVFFSFLLFFSDGRVHAGCWCRL